MEPQRRAAGARRAAVARGPRDPAHAARAVRRAHRAALRAHPAVRRRGRTRRPRRSPPGRCRPCRRSCSTATPTCARRSPTRARSPLRIPGAQFLEVPFVGHSVLGADPTGLRARRRRRVLRRPAPCSRARADGAAVPADAGSRRRGCRQVPGAGRERKAANAAAETLQDVGEVFLGDRRRPPQAAARRHADRRPALAAPRAGRRPGSACARVQYVPGVLVTGFAPRSRRGDDDA